ncbi:hypothetical protein Pcinc_036709 [Petrolisthes cinctipes]|uniref:Uncharacterized protein n=1 Tax=Petrolisthes cinctipes TaxID=88211 RepID=A0AAE1BVL5_PETCI|nr:hypothetical protein Pcinc_036709 [Petrolisthes cinctipes]
MTQEVTARGVGHAVTATRRLLFTPAPRGTLALAPTALTPVLAHHALASFSVCGRRKSLISPSLTPAASTPTNPNTAPSTQHRIPSLSLSTLTGMPPYSQHACPGKPQQAVISNSAFVSSHPSLLSSSHPSLLSSSPPITHPSSPPLTHPSSPPLKYSSSPPLKYSSSPPITHPSSLPLIHPFSPPPLLSSPQVSFLSSFQVSLLSFSPLLLL